MDATILFLSIAIFLVFMVFLVRTAYRNGVRDGYQNNYLPHIRKQIRDEGLEQYWTGTSDWKDEEEEE